MKLSLLSKTLVQGILPGALVVALAFPPDIFAQKPEPDHVVGSQALQQQLKINSETRQKEINTLKGFLSGPQAERAMRDAHINPDQVRTAIPTLSDEELASLSTRATDAQQKFSAGLIGNELLLIIIVLVAVIIIVAVVH